MRRIVVTGANKGIGLAIVKAILEHAPDTFVFLGSRDRDRGRAAAASLAEAEPAWASRIEVVELDVASDASVAAAASQVAASAAGGKLYGLVNNAGVGSRGRKLAEVFEVNTLGLKRACDAFVPLLEPKSGRVVNVTSASGPMFVATCSPEMQRMFLDDTIEWPQLRAFIDMCLAIGGDKKAFAAKGLADGYGYGLSKACANSYTLLLAREHPALRVNACHPGFIHTDMTHFLIAEKKKAAAEIGMKPPAVGARTPMVLLFGELEGNGRYYGSDAKRSPLDRHRLPGQPRYTGR